MKKAILIIILTISIIFISSCVEDTNKNFSCYFDISTPYLLYSDNTILKGETCLSFIEEKCISDVKYNYVCSLDNIRVFEEKDYITAKCLCEGTRI